MRDEYNVSVDLVGLCKYLNKPVTPQPTDPQTPKLTILLICRL